MPEVILLTGATGFIGRNLLPALVAAGHAVYAASRSPERAQRQLGNPTRHFDAHDGSTVDAALEGCTTAYYLVHGLREGAGYDEREAQAARRFADAAKRQGLKRIIYLGGVEPQGKPSRHLQSRLKVGRILRAGTVPTIELRASMVIGGGSESWKMVRDVAMRLPLMVFPKWLESRTQPVALADVIAALEFAATMPISGSEIFDIPGPDTLSGAEIIKRTAAMRGTEPRALQVPWLSPKLSYLWLRMMTRADSHVVRELIEGLEHDLLAREQTLWTHMPEHDRVSFDEAAERALQDEEQSVSPRVREFERAFRNLVPEWLTAKS